MVFYSDVFPSTLGPDISKKNIVSPVITIYEAALSIKGITYKIIDGDLFKTKFNTPLKRVSVEK